MALFNKLFSPRKSNPSNKDNVRLVICFDLNNILLLKTIPYSPRNWIHKILSIFSNPQNIFLILWDDRFTKILHFLYPVDCWKNWTGAYILKLNAFLFRDKLHLYFIEMIPWKNLFDFLIIHWSNFSFTHNDTEELF